MFPAAVGTDVARATQPLATAAANDGVLTVASPGIARAGAVVVVWACLTLGVGWLLLERFTASTRAIRDDIDDRPDLVFPVGFIVFFGLLVLVSLPLFATSVLEVPVVGAIGTVVALPSLALWGVLAIVGGAYGTLAVGDWLAGRVGSDTPSAWSSLILGTITVGSSQFVPVLGAVVVMSVATVGTGAVVRRRLDDGSDDRSATDDADEPMAPRVGDSSMDDPLAVDRGADDGRSRGRERDSAITRTRGNSADRRRR